MNLHTASEIISYIKKIETGSATFYEQLGQRHLSEETVFQDFAAENRSNIKRVTRVYYGVVSDAFEGCFAFDLDPDKYAIEVPLPEQTDYRQVLSSAARMEEEIARVYAAAAEQSGSLIGDISRVFLDIAGKRSARPEKLNMIREAALK